jgi:hypothetical protein
MAGADAKADLQLEMAVGTSPSYGFGNAPIIFLTHDSMNSTSCGATNREEGRRGEGT